MSGITFKVTCHRPCSACGASGVVLAYGAGHQPQSLTCPDCNGSKEGRSETIAMKAWNWFDARNFAQQVFGCERHELSFEYAENLADRELMAELAWHGEDNSGRGQARHLEARLMQSDGTWGPWRPVQEA